MYNPDKTYKGDVPEHITSDLMHEFTVRLVSKVTGKSRTVTVEGNYADNTWKKAEQLYGWFYKLKSIQLTKVGS